MDVDSNGVSQALSSIEAALNSIQKAINNVQSAQGSLDSRISGKIGGFGGAISSLTSALSSTKTIISKCDEYISETSDAILFLQNLTSELLGDMTNDDILSLGKGPLNKEFLEDPEGYMKKINDEKAKKELKEKLIEYGFSKADAERITRGEIDNDILQQRISEVQSEIFNEYCNGNSERYEQLVTAALFNGLYFSRSESTDRKKEIETSISELETGKKTSKKERELYEKAINGAKYDSKNGVYVYNDNGSIRTFDKVSFEMLKEMRDSAISNEEAYDAQIKLLNEELKEIDTKLSDPTRKDFTYKSMAEIDARIKEITNSQQGKTDEEKKVLETEKEELLYIKTAIEANVQYALKNDKYRYQSDFEENNGFNADETREKTYFNNGGNIVVNIFGIEDGKYTFMDNDEYRGALLSRMLNGDAIIIPDFQGSALNVCGQDGQEYYFYGNERQLTFNEYQEWINARTEENENESAVITPTEIKIFNYICNTEGYEAGYKYLKENEIEFDKRAVEIKTAKDSKNAHNNGWLGAVSLFTAIPEAIMNTGKINTRKSAGQQLHLGDSYSTSNTWNATISSDMHKYSDILGYAYDTLYSADRMLLSAVTSYATGGTGALGSIATNGVMYGLPTFTNTVYTSKTKNIDDDRALRYALVCATARTLAISYNLTKASGLEPTFNNMLTNGNVMSKISSIVSGSSILSKNPEFAKNLLLAGYCMVSQGTVAGTTAVVDKNLTSVADILINGDMSEANIKFKNYKELHEGCSDFEAYMNIAGDNLSNSFSAYISAFGPGALLGMVKASGIIEHQKTLPQNINFKEAFEIDKKSPQEEFVSSGNNNPSGGPSGGLRPSSNPSNDSGPSGKTSDNKTELSSSGSSDWIVVKPKVPGEDDFDDFPDDINVKASNAFNAHAMQQAANGQDVTMLGGETNNNAESGYWQTQEVAMSVGENGLSVPNATKSVWVSESGNSTQGSIQHVNANDVLNVDSTANLPQNDNTIPNLTDSYGVKVPVETLIDGKPVDSFTVIDAKGNNDSFVLPFAPTLAGISNTGNTSLLSKLQTTGSLTKTDWCKLTGAFTKKQLAEVKKLEDIETNITNNGNKVTKEDFNYLYKKSGLPLNFQKKIQQKFENDGLITEKYTTDSAVDSTDKSASSSSPDLYHIDTMPQSEIPKRQEAITKILKGEKLNIGDRLALGGRDHVVKEIDGYQLKPDHVYRVTDIKAWEDYVKNGKIVRNVPDFIPGENNGGVDWYLGGAANPTGRYSDGENTIIIEAPADKKYFTPSLDNGLGMADDISVRHMKSSSQANPVPLSMVKVIKGQDVIDNWTNIQKFKTILGKEISDVSQNKDGTITVTTRYGEKLNITNDGLNSQNFEHEILEKNREYENALKNDVTSTFYHGGVTSDFDKSQIDILHKGEKQSTKNSKYSGFYMYGDQNYDGAVGYAKQSGKDKGVIELTLSNDLKIHEVPPFKITRITPDEIKKLQDEGFDLIKGKMLGKDEYVLLNKDKIIETKFHNLNPNVSTKVESIDDDKSDTLKIDTNSLVKSIIGKDQLSDNQQRILSEQVARYMRLSAQNIASNPVHLDKDGKFELQAGDLIHVSNIGNLESIAQKGILTGQAVGVEEFMETYFCADFFRVPQKESLSTFTENFRENYTKGLPSDYDMSEPTIRSFDIGFVVTPTEQNKDLLSYDAYERKDSFSTENTAATRAFVNTKGLLDYEGAAPYATNGGYSSILYGVPASQISTIMVGNGWVVRDVEKTIQEYCDAQKDVVGFDSLKPVVEKQARITFAKRGEEAGIEDYTVDKFIDKLHGLFPKANIVSYDGTVLYDASKSVANLGNEQINTDENSSTPIVLRSPDEILEAYMKTGMDKYSHYDLKSTLDESDTLFYIKGQSEELKKYLELATTKESQEVLSEILLNGGYNGLGFDSELCSHDNRRAELARRLSMATLYLTNPETFMSLAENGINMFHGTNSSILSSVLENGLNSVDKIEQSGKTVTTGEFGTLNSGTFDMHNSIRGRNFISFTDIFDLSYGYARTKDDGTFKVIIGTTADDINSSRKVSISGDLTEIGVGDNLPVDKIKTILVPGDKVEYVKTMVGDKDIKVLSLDGYDQKAFHYYDSFYSLPDSKFDEFAKYVKDRNMTTKNTSSDDIEVQSTQVAYENIHVIDVSKIDTEKHDTDLNNSVDSNIMNMSYKGYDLVFKPNSDVDSVISEIVREKPAGKILLELESTKGLTIENLSLLPDNVEIRVLGDYGIEYFNGFPSNYDENALASLNNATYSVSEMKEIMKVINDFDSGIQSSWDDVVKAEYAYQYLTEILVMGCRFVADVGIENINNNKIYDGLMGLLNKSSSDKGLAHIYKELLNRMNIKCTEVQGIIKPPSKKDKGTLNLTGYHVFNVITIDGKNIIVDVSRDKMGPEYNGSGFGVINQSEYEFVSSRELADNLITMRKLKLKRVAKYIKKKYTKNTKLANEGEIWDYESIFSGITSSNTERVKNLINWTKTKGIKKIIDFFDGKIDASKIDLSKLIILEEEEYYALLDAEGEDKSTLGFNIGNVSVIGVPSSVLVSSHIYEAIIHELLHQISSPDDYCFWDIDEETFYKISGFDILINKGDLDRRITQLGDAPTPYKGFNEAVTDYFAGLIFPKGAHTSGYNNIVDGLKRILSLNIPGFNVETLKKGYLNNDISIFKNVIDEIVGEGFFENELCPAFNKAQNGNSSYKQMLDETIDMLEMIIDTNRLLLEKYTEYYVSNNKFNYAKFNKLFELFGTQDFSKKSFEEQVKMISEIVDYDCLPVALKDMMSEVLREMKNNDIVAESDTVKVINAQSNDETNASNITTQKTSKISEFMLKIKGFKEVEFTNTVYGTIANNLKSDVGIEFEKMYVRGKEVIALDKSGNQYEFDYYADGSWHEQYENLVKKFTKEYAVKIINDKTDMFDLFEQHGSVYQGVLKNLSKEEQKIIVKYAEQKYGLSEIDTKILINSIDRTGACTYANMCNIIYTLYKNNEVLFEKDFGYKMYNSDGSFNDSQLLFDLYVVANGVMGNNLLIKTSDGKFAINKEFLLSHKVLDDEKQRYMSIADYYGFRAGYLKVFLDVAHHSSIDISNLYNLVQDTRMLGATDLVSMVNDCIKNGDIITDIDIYNGATMYRVSDGRKEIIPKNEGHSVTFVGTNNDGFFVRSWGELWYIPVQQFDTNSNQRENPWGLLSIMHKKEE